MPPRRRRLDQHYPTDDAVLSPFDYPHTGLPRRCPRIRPQPRLGEATIPACPDNRELRDHGENVEKQPSDGVGRIVDGAAKAELDIAFGELVQDVASIRQRPCQPIQLGHHQCVAGSAGGQRQCQTGPVAVSAGQAVVDIDAIIADAERMQAVALGGEILLLC